MNKPTSDPLGLVNTDAAAAAPPRSSARESAALNSLLALHNNAAGTLLNTVQPEPTPAPTVTLPSGPYKIQPSSAKSLEPVTHARSPFDPRLLFFSGLLKAGKDHVAAAAGATIFSFASPLYRMREVFFGEGLNKDQFGARQFLQTAGNWGRNTISSQYPLGPSRANFVMMVRSMGTRGEFSFPEVDWNAFGRDENLWLNAMLKRVEKYREQHGNEDVRCACVNARFANEHKALTEAGFTHWHVMCSTETWQARVRAAGLDPASPAMQDESEQLALNLNKQAIQASLRAPTRKLRVIWSDDKLPPPSQAFHTIESFKQDLELFS